jgi:hypothetical protein
MAESTVTAPPVEAVLSEVFTTLALSAHAYLNGAEEGAAPDLPAAEIAIDLAAIAYEKAQSRLRPEERAAMAGMLTDLRMAFVGKRGT